MTPKEKAQELLDKYIPHGYPFSAGSGYLSGDFDKDSQKKHAKVLAIICVDEINNTVFINTNKDDPYSNVFAHDYWNEVKQEIELI